METKFESFEFEASERSTEVHGGTSTERMRENERVRLRGWCVSARERGLEFERSRMPARAHAVLHDA